MLPYPGDLRFHITEHWVVSPFGPLVATGVLLGRHWVIKRAEEMKVATEEIRSAAEYSLLFGFIGAHVLDVLFYHPYRITQDGIWTLFKLWDGLSSFGGLVSALIGLAVFRVRLGRSAMVHFDSLIQGLMIGWVFGRLGCTVMFDHPGVLSQFALAFDYPGGARHNLGFYEFLYTSIVLVPANLWVYRNGDRKRIEILKALGPKEKPDFSKLPRLALPGAQCAVSALLYAPARFLMDFLRADGNEGGDIRWFFDLTWAQYCCIALFALGIYLWWGYRTPQEARAR